MPWVTSRRSCSLFKPTTNVINIDLSSKFILITGALSGVAEAMVTRLLEGGAHLFLTDIVDDAGASEKLKKWSESSTQFTYQQMDVTDPQSCRTAIAEAFRIYPQLNIVLGHAGGCALHPFATTSQHEWDRLIKFNLLGQSYVARPVLEQWVERKVRGHLIFTSSFVSKIPWKGHTAYSTAKAGVEMFARSLALEYAEFGIRVNCVSPGNVAAGKSVETYENDSEYRATVDRVSPMGMRNSATAIGDAFVYLCSSLADEITGHVLQVDAGVSLPKLV